MTDESQLDQDVTRAKRAEALLGDSLIAEAFETLRAEYLKKWEESVSRDQDARERLWWAVRVLNEVQTHLRNVVSDGKLAQAQLDQMARGVTRPIRVV